MPHSPLIIAGNLSGPLSIIYQSDQRQSDSFALVGIGRQSLVDLKCECDSAKWKHLSFVDNSALARVRSTGVLQGPGAYAQSCTSLRDDDFSNDNICITLWMKTRENSKYL